MGLGRKARTTCRQRQTDPMHDSGCLTKIGEISKSLTNDWKESFFFLTKKKKPDINAYTLLYFKRKKKNKTHLSSLVSPYKMGAGGKEGKAVVSLNLFRFHVWGRNTLHCVPSEQKAATWRSRRESQEVAALVPA